MASSRSATFRKAGLLILLLAAAIVVVFQYMPREESAEMAAPAKQRAPAPQAPHPASPRQERAPQGEQPSPQSPQPEKSPANPVPPLDYQKPPATVFVSNSPSDAATPAAPKTPAAPTTPATPATPNLTNPQPAPPGESASEPAIAGPMPTGPIPLKVSRNARHWIAKYDTNGDGSLEAAEWKKMAGTPARIDYNADGVITVDELSAYWADYGRNRRMRLTGSMVEAVAETPLWIPTAEQEARAAAEQVAAEKAAEKAAEQMAEKAAGDDSVLPVALPDDSEDPTALAADSAEEPQEPAPAEKPASPPNARRFVTPKSRLAGLPDWFLARDSNGDGQLTLAEFAPDGSAQRLADFKRLDRNGDGVLAPEECPR